MRRTTLTLDEATQRRLRKIAADRGISAATLIREALEDIIERYTRTPRSLGIGASSVRDTGRLAGEVRAEPNAWR